MNVKPKFKVGDFVRVKGYIAQPNLTGQKWRVIEILTQTCYAGVQIHYKCRGHIRNNYQTGVTKELYQFLEIELEPIPKFNAKLFKETQKKLEKIKLKKQQYIKDQDFEKAAGLRAEEKDLEEQLINMKEFDDL